MALPATFSGMTPVRLLKDEESIRVYYAESVATFSLDPAKPVVALQSVTANDDATVVEVVDDTMMAIRQVGEDGLPHTIMLSPRMATELSRLIDSFVFLGPTGADWADGRDLIDL